MASEQARYHALSLAFVRGVACEDVQIQVDVDRYTMDYESRQRHLVYSLFIAPVIQVRGVQIVTTDRVRRRVEELNCLHEASYPCTE